MRPTRKVCDESQSFYKLAFNFRNLSVHPLSKYLKSASKAEISEHEISLVFPLTHPRSSLSVSSLVARDNWVRVRCFHTSTLLKHNVPLKSKITHPTLPPSIARTFDWSFYSYNRDFDPK